MKEGKNILSARVAVDLDGNHYLVLVNKASDALVDITPVDKDTLEPTGEKSRMPLGDLTEEYTLYDIDGNLISEPEDYYEDEEDDHLHESVQIVLADGKDAGKVIRLHESANQKKLLESFSLGELVERDGKTGAYKMTEADVGFIRNALREAEKDYYEMDNVGHAKYTVSKHDGVSTHNDGSPFYDIAIFKNKKKRDDYIGGLRKDGYLARGEKRPSPDSILNESSSSNSLSVGEKNQKAGKALRESKGGAGAIAGKYIQVAYAYADVCEDSYEKGELNSVNNYNLEISGKLYESYEEFVTALCDEFGCDKVKEYLDSIEYDDFNGGEGNFYTDMTVDEDNLYPSESDFEEWKKGEKMLFNAHCYFKLNISDIHPATSVEALKNL